MKPVYEEFYSDLGNVVRTISKGRRWPVSFALATRVHDDANAFRWGNAGPIIWKIELLYGA